MLQLSLVLQCLFMGETNFSGGRKQIVLTFDVGTELPGASSRPAEAAQGDAEPSRTRRRPAAAQCCSPSPLGSARGGLAGVRRWEPAGSALNS